MTKDRITELQNNTSRPHISYRRLSAQDINHEDQIQITHQSTIINIENQTEINEFLHEIDGIRSVIDKIDELIQQVKRIHIEMLQSRANPKLDQELNDKTEEIKKLAYETSTRLKKMEQTQENRDEHEKNTAQGRIHGSQICVLTRRFRNTMMQHNQETVAHRERCKKAIVHELYIAGQHKTNDEVEDMLENGFPGVFNFSILVDVQKAKQCLTEIEARYRDIIKLENSMRELYSMFADLAMLVADQGEMVDSIEYNVSKAVDYVQDAAENVVVAEQYGKKAVKKKILILCILFVSLILIFIIILIGYFTQRKLRGG